MGTILREIDKDNDQELDLVTRRCMDTVLDTIPEFENDSQKAHLAFGNFTFDQMRRMLEDTFSNPKYRIVVAVDDISNQLVGHAIFSLKSDDAGKQFGSCYSRYVAPTFRRKNIASALLAEAEKWWVQQGAEYALAQTHVGNLALQSLFKKHGFSLSDVKNGKFPYYELRKILK